MSFPALLKNILLTGIVVGSLHAQAQNSAPPGYALVDDMILPESVVYADAAFTATPWPGGVVFYAFNANVSATNQLLVRQAMDEISAVSGVIFVPHSTTPDWIVFNAATVNNSFVGMVGGAQTINIANWNVKYIIVHEIMHALGFVHEQSRPDRGSFVAINAANISTTACPGSNCGGAASSSCACNFNIVNGATMATPYDFLSIMHYARNSFTSNGQDTITCLPAFASFQTQIGNRAFMSLGDATGLQARYGTSGVAPNLTSISPPFVTTATGSFTLHVYGDNFFGGSPNANGVQGTKIQWNGVVIPTTFEDSGHLTAQIPASLIAEPQQITISVINSTPGVGFGLGSATLSVSCQAGGLGLAIGVPATITNGCQAFFISPASNVFNVVGVSSISDWNLQMGSGLAAAGGNESDFVVGSGWFGSGTVQPTNGSLTLGSGFSSARVEHLTSTPIVAGQPTIDSLAAGSNFRAFHFQANAVSTRTIHVAGPTSLRWKLLSGGSSFSWRSSETQAIASGVVGGSPVPNISVSNGYYCLVVYKNGSAPTTSQAITVSMCFDFTPTALTASNNVVTINQGAYACVPFSITPLNGKWNAVGVSSPSDWDLQIGPAVSQQGGATCDYVLANGHMGSIAPLVGVCSPYSLSGSAGYLQFGATTTVPPALGSQSAPATEVIQAFEFEVTTPGNYDIRVSATSYAWDLHGPGTTSTWRRATDRLAGPFPSATTVTVPNLTPGWHCVVVYHNGGIGQHGIFQSVLVNFSGTQPPTLASITPNEAAAGSGTFAITAEGSNFLAASAVRWNGTPLPTTYVSATELQATVAASLLTSPGTALLTVNTPGGGTSGSLPFTIGNPVPSLTSLSPDYAITGDPQTTLTMTGTDFVPGCEARWNGAPLATTFVSATQVTAIVPEGLLTASWGLPLDVENPGPGGGISDPVYFSIYGPIPTVLTPESIPVQAPNTAPITLIVDGVFFQTSSTIWVDGVALPTTYLSEFQLQADLDSALLPQMLEPGGMCINVSNTPDSVSYNLAIPVGTGTNNGTVRLDPLAPLPGGVFALWMETPAVQAPVSVWVDFSNPAPIPQWPNAVANLVLGIDPLSPISIPFRDGLGIYGPPDGSTTDVAGYFVLTDLVMPNPALGVTVAVQAAYVDPTSVLGVNLTWTRRIDL